jgi:hypothetical protein
MVLKSKGENEKAHEVELKYLKLLEYLDEEEDWFILEIKNKSFCDDCKLEGNFEKYLHYYLESAKFE